MNTLASKLREDIKETSNDDTNPFRCYLPQNLGVNANLALLWSAVAHMERAGLDFKYNNIQVGDFLNLSGRTATTLVGELVSKGLLVSTLDKVRELKITELSKELAFIKGVI